MPADVDAPDKVLYGLTFRQIAILAVAAVIFYAAWRTLHRLLPVPVLLGAGIVLGALAFGLVVGRRDGLSLDRWLWHAVVHSRAPKALSTVDTTTRVPDWVDQPRQRVALPAPLRLPATAIDDGGQITLGTSSQAGRAAMVAATTVNLGLRTGEEQAALIDTYGRWLNSLSSPTEIVVSAQPVDLASHARTVAARARRMPNPALEAACADHAAFLDDLAKRRDPLRRQVLIVARTSTAEAGEHAARRRADDTARALSGLGVTVRALDGAAATAALAAAADPYHPPRPGRRAAPDTVITGPAGGTPRKRRKP
jgi:hypothetical protein